MEQHGYYLFGDFVLDVHERTLHRNGEQSYLTPRTFDTLLTLVSRQGELLEKERLIGLIWSGGVVSDNALTRCIKEVRTALGDLATQPRFVETVPRVGYRFIAPVEFRESLESSSAEGGRPGRAAWWMLAAVIALGLMAWLLLSDQEDAQPENSVAVLPFANIGPDSESEYFADGVTEEILNALARSEALKVIARTSAFSFKGQEKDVRDIARTLGVRYVVEGSVRREANRLRVTAKLIEAESGFQYWSDTFEGPVTDIFAFQDSIARDVGRVLADRLALPDTPGAGLSPSHVTSTAVYDRYLLARQVWRQRDEGPVRRSIELLEQVVAEDPEFGRGWSSLAAAYTTLLAYSADPGPAHERAVSAAQRALELDPADAEAYAVLASGAVSNRDWLEAEAYFRQARRLSPNSPTIRLWYSEMLAKLGRIRHALDEVGVALDVDPLYTPALGNAGHQLATAGRVTEAAQVFQRAWDLGLEAMFVWFGNFYVAYMQERFGDAERWLEKRPFPQGGAADRALLAYGRQPDRERRAELVAVTTSGLRQGMDIREGAMYLAEAGAIDEAYEFLFDAVGSGWISTESLWNDWTREIRQDQRFSELVDTLGMHAYWQAHGAPDGCRLDGTHLVCE